MSKNITIQEGGVAKQLTANKLKTNLVSGGICLWVPEDEATLGTKIITENGTYKAIDDGYYGYSEVTVSGIGTATGTGPDGEDHSYSEDGEGGVTDTVLPASISVVTPPTVTTYADGATIDFSGMVVKGYLKSGGIWTNAEHPNGIIPINELTLPVTIADRDDGHSGEYSDGAGVNAKLITYTPHVDTAKNKEDRILYLSEVLGSHNGFDAMLGTYTGGFMAVFLVTFYEGYIYVKGIQGNETLNGWYHNPDPARGQGVYEYGIFMGSGLSSGYTNFHKGPSQDLYSWATAIPVSTANPENAGTMEPVLVNQTIPVQFLRSDGKILESSFDITVN